MIVILLHCSVRSSAQLRRGILETRGERRVSRPRKKQKRGHVLDHTHEQDLAGNGLLVL